MKVRFRFQTLDIWKRAITIGDRLLDIADQLEVRHRYRFAEQLRGAALSVSNNIAEGSGSASDKDFAHFLNIAKRSAFENANMVLAFHRRQLISDVEVGSLLEELETECRMIESFRKRLKY
ncbi:MAG: four helix bundle protein [Verrucomicrobiae bacterium]|nr:four helix bundle protein [Verrucomicrobiae bacterium]